jgi:hypothetical protein
LYAVKLTYYKDGVVHRTSLVQFLSLEKANAFFDAVAEMAFRDWDRTDLAERVAPDAPVRI